MSTEEAEKMSARAEALDRLATALCTLCNRVIDFDPTPGTRSAAPST